MLQELARYWASDYDSRTCEATLNALPHFITEIDGLDIHFIHVKSQHDDALPLVVNHGWPGSIIEQLKIIDRTGLIPPRMAGSAADAFHVVIPSMPGYGFSAPTSTGWGPERMGRAWAELRSTGYTRHVAQGGDWGAFVVDRCGRRNSRDCSPSTPTCSGLFPLTSTGFLAGGPPPDGLAAEERRAYEQPPGRTSRLSTPGTWGRVRQTLYGIADSPVGLAALAAGPQ